jgi:hypothetical protein
MKSRNRILFAVGRFVSLMGTNMYQFAAGLYVLKITGSGTRFALTLVLGTLPRVLAAPFAGVLADRLPRKYIVVLTDIVSGISLIALWRMTYGSRIGVLEVYISMILLTTLNTFFDIAIESAKPEIVETKEALERLNALSYGIHSFTSITGPVLGGLIYALVPFRVFVLVNGISFVVSGISETFIEFTSDGSDRIEDYDQGFTKALMGGIAYLKRNPFSISLMSFSLCINFCLTLAITVPLPYMFNTTLGMTSTWVGIVTSGFPIGYLLGTIWIQRFGIKSRGQSFRTGSLSVLMGMGAMVLVLLMSPVASEEVIAVMTSVTLAIIGVAIAYIDIPLMSFLQLAIPSYVRGRVFSVMTMASRTAMPVAMLVSGKLLTVLYPVTILMIGTTLYLIQLLVVSRSAYLNEYITTNTIATLSSDYF